MLTRALVSACVLLVVGSARDATACQYDECHSDGAVQKPDGFDLSLPFETGEAVLITAGYGPSAGSSLHCRAQDSQCANDYYALDLTLKNHGNHGKGQPVLAIAAGTVIDAAWGSSGWANYGRRVYIRHDFDDGHTYTSMYAHLDSMAVSTGEHVAQGDLIGTLGQSCQGASSCSSFSTPHLHFALHRDSKLGGSGSGGSYGGRAVIAEPIDGYTGIGKNDVLTSGNDGPEPPPDDPPDAACDVTIPAGGATLEEDGPCATLTGSAHLSAEGHGGHTYWAPADIPAPDYAEGVIYHFEMEAAGAFDVWAYMPDTVSDRTPQAVYKLKHGGDTQKLTVDQSWAAGGWLQLGTFDFAAGGDQWLRLGDTYLDDAGKGKAVVMDAIQLTTPGTPPDSEPPDAPDDPPAEDAVATADDAAVADVAARPPADIAVPGETGPIVIGGTPDGGPPPTGPTRVTSGGCATGGHTSDPAWAYLLLLALGARIKLRRPQN